MRFWSRSSRVVLSVLSSSRARSSQVDSKSRRSLISIDFDHTLLDADSDSQLKSLVPDSEIPDDVKKLATEKNGWPAYMRWIFFNLHRCGLGQKDYEDCLSKMSLMPGMKELFTRAYETGKYDIIIISDANSFFIDYILEQNSIKHIVKEVFTNPAFFDDTGCLQIKEYQMQNWCKRCTRNICKGSILQGYLSRVAEENNVFYNRLSYIGDGSNDVCPALKLRPTDFAFARVDSCMLKTLRQLPKNSISATIVPWESGYDILEVLFPSGDQPTK